MLMHFSSTLRDFLFKIENAAWKHFPFLHTFSTLKDFLCFHGLLGVWMRPGLVLVQGVPPQASWQVVFPIPLRGDPGLRRNPSPGRWLSLSCPMCTVGTSPGCCHHEDERARSGAQCRPRGAADVRGGCGDPRKQEQRGVTEWKRCR